MLLISQETSITVFCCRCAFGNKLLQLSFKKEVALCPVSKYLSVPDGGTTTFLQARVLLVLGKKCTDPLTAPCITACSYKFLCESDFPVVTT